MRSSFATIAVAAVAASQVASAMDLNVNDASSVKNAASAIAKDLWSYYKGNTDSSQLGILPKPYYWWESGAMFGTMLSYSYMTGDKTYNDDVAKAIFSQISPTKDFMMMNQADNLGNDDQAFWALTAMSAAEHKLTPPSGQPDDIWLTAASGAFDRLIGRWNTTFCGGGIKWQFIQTNNGFNYKSSIANAATMQLGARLALLTGEQSYADKATMVYDWMTTIGYVSDSFQVYDGAGDDPDNCTKIDFHEWSYNSGALIGGAAAMANYTASKNSPDAKAWADRTTGLWQHATQNFFKDNVLYEQPCEDVGTCNTDQFSFKAYMARWATFAGQIFPSIQADVVSKLQSSATAAAKSCTGNGGAACGTQWYNNNYNGKTGVGQAMSGLEVMAGLFGPSVQFVTGKASDNTGSSSPSAASSAVSSSSPSSAAPASSASSDVASSVPTTVASSLPVSASAAALASSLAAAASSAATATDPAAKAAATSLAAAASSAAAVAGGNAPAAASQPGANFIAGTNSSSVPALGVSTVTMDNGLIGKVSVGAVTSCVPTTTYQTITVTETSTAKTTPVATTAPYAIKSTVVGGVASATNSVIKPSTTPTGIAQSNGAAGLSASFGGLALAVAAAVLFT